jgi:hypothetical protein
VLSGRDHYDGLITRPEESYRLWLVVVCDNETSCDEEAIARAGLQGRKTNNNNNNNNDNNNSISQTKYVSKVHGVAVLL